MLEDYEASRRRGIDLERLREQDDVDYDYDVYLWWHSRQPRPEDFDDVFPSVPPSLCEDYSDDESLPFYDDLPSVQQAEIVDPAQQPSVQAELCSQGYSGFFISGMMAKSQQVARRFERVWKGIRRCMAITSKKLLSLIRA